MPDGFGPQPDWGSVVRAALREDRVREDVTTGLLGAAGTQEAEGQFVAEERLVLAGLPGVEIVLHELDPLAEVLLGAERVVLNLLQHLSGIATATRRLVELVSGTAARITHTRKTLPGLRGLELYAVSVGGGVPNRASLADAVLGKDNHWALLGDPSGLGEALKAAPAGCEVVVEVETGAQLEVALAAGVRHLLLDNQTPEQVARWVRQAGPNVTIQASGGITESTARAYAEAGAHLLAVGQITHSVRAAAIRCDVL